VRKIDREWEIEVKEQKYVSVTVVEDDDLLEYSQT
jgi:hypothetical protein